MTLLAGIASTIARCELLLQTLSSRYMVPILLDVGAGVNIMLYS